MSWVQDQIRQRMENDQEQMEDSLLGMADVVLDRWNSQKIRDELLTAREAIGDILKYYHQKPPEIPVEIKDIDEQLRYALRPSGLMTRDVLLGKGWYRNAYGPMLAYIKETRKTVALLPGAFSGYYFKDPETGERTRINSSNEGLFAEDALCFYRPLPAKPLGIPHLMRFMLEHISNGDVVMIVAATLAVTLVGMIEPRVYNLVTGPILESRQMTLMMGMAAFLMTAAFASAMLTMVRDLLVERISIKASRAVEASVMMRILALPQSFFRKYSSGELSARVDSVNTLCDKLINNILATGLTSLLSLLYITQIFRYAPALVWPSILILVLTMALSLATSLLQVRVTRRKMSLRAQEKGMSYAVLNGIRKIRVAGAEKRIFARWGNLYAKRAMQEYDPPIFLKLSTVLLLAVSLIGNILLYYLAVKNGVTPNEYYGFSAAYGRVMAAFAALAGIAASAADIRPSLEMAEPILKEMPEMSGEKEPMESLSGHIEMSHVSFRYDEKSPYIFEDLSIDIRAGEYVAIVGRTGCGKSTLVRLMLGFERPEKGAVFYDRNDLRDIDPASLRRHIGVVIQNGQLFQGDIFSNITISAPHLSMKAAWDAARTAGIADDIEAMPMKMRTIISEGQGGISGGQKQRIMIARAIVHKPRLLIFDEATSALDNKTQKQIADALDELECTRIVIAHRLSTIRHCDRILVLDQGRIVEEGSFEELMERNGVFAELVERQMVEQQTVD